MFEKSYVYKTPFLCNASCKFCLSDASLIKKKYKYSLKKIIKDLLEVKKLGFKTVILVGGEPSIIENLSDFIRVSNKLGLELVVTTNGIVFSDFEYLKFLNNLGLKNIIFSIHSNISSEHDMLVGIPGAFDSIVRAIKNANKLDFKHISTSSVINKINENKLVDIIKFIRLNFDININNFCNLEVSYKSANDYDSKKDLFSDLSIIKNQIELIHQKFGNDLGKIGIQNLPLCAFTEETFYLTHEISGKERYYEKDFSNDEFDMNQRVKGEKCISCKMNDKCKGYFPYFKEKDLEAF